MAIGFGKKHHQMKELEKTIEEVFRLHPEQQKLLITAIVSKTEAALTFITENKTEICALTADGMAARVQALEQKFSEGELKSRALEDLSQLSDDDVRQRLLFLVTTLHSITNGLLSTIQKVAA